MCKLRYTQGLQIQGDPAWYWTCWFTTAGLSYAAIELGGVDPLMVAAKFETFLGWEPMSVDIRGPIVPIYLL